MIKHIIWDWNGTLLDDADACVQALNVMLRRRGLKEMTTDVYQEKFGFPVKDFYTAMGLDFARDDWDAVTREYHRIYAVVSRAAPLRAETAPTLAALAEAGIPLSILSASEMSLLRRMVAERRIGGFFRHIFGLSNLYAHSKMELGRQLLRECGASAGETLIVGDTIHDHEVAIELRCRCLLLAGGHQAEHRLLSCGCPVVEAMSEIPERVRGM